VEAKIPNSRVHEPSPGTGLGERLAAAREARGMTLAYVARSLRLSTATLQALESSRYEDLPEPIYVRGYLRAYARLLELDTEVFVTEYERLVNKPVPVLTPTTKVRRQASVRALYIRGATALIMVAMMVLFVSWWYSRLNQDVSAEPPTASLEAEQTVSPASVLPPSQTVSPTPGSGSVVTLSPELPPESLASEAAEDSVGTFEPEPPIGATAAAAEPAMPLVTESPVTVNPDAVVQRRDMETTMEPSVPDLPIAPLASEHGQLVRASRAPKGGDVLVITANDESWAEVVDANGYQLLYYLLQPGMVRHMQGQAPFRVFLGNAPAVDLSLNQKQFDHSPFRRRNNTALFSVDGPS